jgi:hypothetical protein
MGFGSRKLGNKPKRIKKPDLGGRSGFFRKRK